MIEHEKVAVREKVVSLMTLVSSRNRAEYENQYPALIQSLANETDVELVNLCSFVQGVAFFIQNSYDQAKKTFEGILNSAVKKNDILGMAHMGLGLTYRSTGDQDMAVTHLTTAASLIDARGVFRGFLAYCYQSLGDLNNQIQEYEIAIDYFEQGLAASGDHEQSVAQFRYHMGMGGTYMNMKEYEKSRFHLTKALEGDDLPQPIIARIETDLGQLHYELGNFEEAERLLKSSLTIREKLGHEDAACTTMTALAEVYLEQDRVDEVLQLADRCSLLVNKYHTKAKKLKLLRLMARVQTRVKNFEAAVKFYEEYNALYDEIKSDQERNIFKFKNQQIETQRKIIQDKHAELAATFEEIKRLKVDRKASLFSWGTIIALFILSEVVLDPLIESYAYNNILSLLVKAAIALMFKPIDGLYEKILWERTIRKVD